MAPSKLGAILNHYGVSHLTFCDKRLITAKLISTKHNVNGGSRSSSQSECQLNINLAVKL